MENINTEIDFNDNNNAFKYLHRDMDRGKIIVTDYNNKNYESDIFGRKLKCFLPNISGMLSGVNRSNLTLKVNNSKSLNNISDNKIINFNSQKKSLYNNYHPGIKKIDGYNFVSKPISVPFYNEENLIIPDTIKKKLNNNLKKYYSTENNKIQKNNNFRLSYLNKDLNNHQMEKKDEKQIMNLINRNIEELKEDSKRKLNSVEKNPNYIALNQFKKRIIENNKKSPYLNFEEVPLEIKDKYNIIRNVIKNRLSELKKKQNIVERKEKEYLNQYIKSSRSNSLFDMKKKKSNLKDLIIGPDKLNDICKSKDFAIGRTIKMDFGNTKEINHSKEKDTNINNEDKKELTQNEKINNILPKIVNRISSENKSNLYQDTDTAETNTYLNRNNSDILLGRNKSYDELSYVSIENNKNNIKEKQKNNFRSLKFIKNNAEMEKELLKGIKIEIPKEINIAQKNKGKVILKTEGDLYKKNIELLKVTNKKQYEIQKHKDEYDLLLLKKKLGDKKRLSLVMNSN